MCFPKYVHQHQAAIEAEEEEKRALKLKNRKEMEKMLAANQDLQQRRAERIAEELEVGFVQRDIGANMGEMCRYGTAIPQIEGDRNSSSLPKGMLQRRSHAFVVSRRFRKPANEPQLAG